MQALYADVFIVRGLLRFIISLSVVFTVVLNFISHAAIIHVGANDLVHTTEAHDSSYFAKARSFLKTWVQIEHPAGVSALLPQSFIEVSKSSFFVELDNTESAFSKYCKNLKNTSSSLFIKDEVEQLVPCQQPRSLVKVLNNTHERSLDYNQSCVCLHKSYYGETVSENYEVKPSLNAHHSGHSKTKALSQEKLISKASKNYIHEYLDDFKSKAQKDYKKYLGSLKGKHPKPYQTSLQSPSSRQSEIVEEFAYRLVNTLGEDHFSLTALHNTKKLMRLTRHSSVYLNETTNKISIEKALKKYIERKTQLSRSDKSELLKRLMIFSEFVWNRTHTEGKSRSSTGHNSSRVADTVFDDILNEKKLQDYWLHLNKIDVFSKKLKIQKKLGGQISSAAALKVNDRYVLTNCHQKMIKDALANAHSYSDSNCYGFVAKEANKYFATPSASLKGHSAFKAPEHLLKMGFEKLPFLDPTKAPAGAIIVYDSYAKGRKLRDSNRYDPSLKKDKRRFEGPLTTFNTIAGYKRSSSMNLFAGHIAIATGRKDYPLVSDFKQKKSVISHPTLKDLEKGWGLNMSKSREYQVVGIYFKREGKKSCT